MFWDTPTRVWIHGAGTIYASLSHDDATDFLVTDITYDSTATSGAQNNFWRWQRFAIVGATVYSNQYALFLLGDTGSEDFILANSQIGSGNGQSVWRIVNTSTRTIAVDSRIATLNGSTHSQRIHQYATDIWFRNCQFEQGGVWWVPDFVGSETPAAVVDRSWFYDNKLYDDGSGINMTFSITSDTMNGYPRVDNMTVYGNEQYTSSGSFPSGSTANLDFAPSVSSPTSPSASNNFVGSRQDPPVWSFN